MKSEPVHCRPEAFQYFASQLPAIESTDGLLRAGVALSMHALDDVDPAAVDLRLQQLADRVRSRVRGKQIQAVLAHLHEVLFVEEDFAGNTQCYHNPLNSYLPAVLETRRGLPVTLALVYKVVAERVGVQVEGINSPGHFLTRVYGDGGSMFVDPFFRGQVLTRQEALHRIGQVTGRELQDGDLYLQPVNHPQWISRMLLNLQSVFATADRRDDLKAMTELQNVLGPLLP